MKWALHDLKANKGIWAGVLLVLVVTQTILCSMNVGMGVNNHNMGMSRQASDAAKHIASGLSLVYATAIVLGCLVVMQTVQASIRQRRQGLALLSLLGATPRQVLWITAAQVMALTLLASFLALVVSPFFAPRILGFYASGFGLSAPTAFIWPDSIRSALDGLAVGLVVALLAVRFTLRDLKMMVPVRMLRRSQGEGPLRKNGRGWALVFLLAAVAVLAMPIASSLYIARRGPASMSRGQIMDVLNFTGSSPLLAILLLLVALARSGGSIIGWATRLWTSLVPSSSAVWKIARSQAVVRSRGKAFGATIVSLTACLFLIGGMLTAGQTSAAAMRRLPGLGDTSSGGPLAVLSGFWAALLIAVVGAVASFAISAHERNLDLALVCVAGAVPNQLLAISALDGVILMTTGILLAAAATGVVGVCTAIAYFPLSGSFSLVFPWQIFVALGLPIIVIGAFATAVTARSSLKRPAIATIQSAIGE